MDDKPKRIQDKIEEVLLEKRRIFLSDAVDQHTANEIIRKLWYLDHLILKNLFYFLSIHQGDL